MRQFRQEELDVVLTKNRKAADLNEIPPEVWKTRKFDDILLRYWNAVCNQYTIDRWTKGCILPFSKKSDIGITKNYWGITLTSIADKIYNALLLNYIEPEIEKILWKNQNGFQMNQSTTSQILTIRRILGVRTKNLKATFFVNFSRAFDSIHKRKMEQILVANSLPRKTVAAIMMFYKNEIKSTPTLLRHRLLWYCRKCAAPYLFIICLDYLLQTSKENGLTLEKARRRRYPAWTITDAD